MGEYFCKLKVLNKGKTVTKIGRIDQNEFKQGNKNSKARIGVEWNVIFYTRYKSLLFFHLIGRVSQ